LTPSRPRRCESSHLFPLSAMILIRSHCLVFLLHVISPVQLNCLMTQDHVTSFSGSGIHTVVCSGST
jgi:hypothetical protein